MMAGTFRIARDIAVKPLPFGSLRSLCDPASTGAKQLTIVEAAISPGQGHDFHNHPAQEEVIYVTGGEVEQWVDKEKRILGPGDSAFIPAGVVHASFNTGKSEARILAIFGPCVGDGFSVVDVSGEAPWNAMRA